MLATAILYMVWRILRCQYRVDTVERHTISPLLPLSVPSALVKVLERMLRGTRMERKKRQSVRVLGLK